MAEKLTVNKYHIFTAHGVAKLSVLEQQEDGSFENHLFDLSAQDLLILQTGVNRALFNLRHNGGK